jgi:hypothetical protein
VDAVVKTDFAGEKFHRPPEFAEQERPQALIVEETPAVFEPRTTAIVQATRFEETRRSQEEVGEAERELYIVKVGQDGIERDREPLPDTALSNLKALFDTFRKKGLPNGLYRIYLEEPGFPRRKVIEFYKSGTSFGDPVQEPGRGSLPVGEPPSQAPPAVEPGEKGPMAERVDRFWSRWAALQGAAARRGASAAMAEEDGEWAAAPALFDDRDVRAPDEDSAWPAQWPNRLKLPLGVAAALGSISLVGRGTEKEWERRIDAAMEDCDAESFTRAARLRRRFRW